jgi:hypothetical protein
VEEAVTRYVCSWCQRKQEGINLTTCEDCPGPLNPLYDPGAALKAAQRRLHDLAREEKAQEPRRRNPRFDRKEAAPVVRDTGPLPPPVPRKPKPLALKPRDGS